MKFSNSVKSVLLVTGLALSSSVFAAVESGKYAIDSVHSSVIFIVDHLGYTNMAGRFNDVSGDVAVSNNKAEIAFEIKSASIDTNHQKRDDHLRSPDFFNAKQFPTITFKSVPTDVESGSTLKGEMVMLGEKKAVEFELTKGKEGKDPWGLYRVGYTAVGKIKRSDFGMNFMQGGLGDEIQVKVFIEAVKQ